MTRGFSGIEMSGNVKFGINHYMSEFKFSSLRARDQFLAIVTKFIWLTYFSGKEMLKLTSSKIR